MNKNKQTETQRKDAKPILNLIYIDEDEVEIYKKQGYEISFYKHYYSRGTDRGCYIVSWKS